MKGLSELWAELLARDVEVWLEGDALRVSAPERAMSPQLVAELRRRKGEIVAWLGPRERLHAPTPAQERLWLLAPSKGAGLQLSVSFEVRGALDLDVLRGALELMVRRHAALRTSFVREGQNLLCSVATSNEVPLLVNDLTHLSSHARLEEARLRAAATANEALVLSRAAWRAHVYQLHHDHALLAFDFHHIIFDGRSKSIFLRELAHLYGALKRRTPPSLPEVPPREPGSVQYGPHELEAWGRALAGAEPLRLPRDGAPRDGLGRCDTQQINLPPALVARLTALARQERASLFHVLLAAYAVTLRGHSGQTDLLLCTPYEGRPTAAQQQQLGYFSNLLPVRLRASFGTPFAALVGEARRVTLDAMALAHVPFYSVADLPALAGVPLARTLFALQYAPERGLELEGTRCRPMPTPKQVADFTLATYLDVRDDLVAGVIEYDSDVLHRSTVADLTTRYLDILERAVQEPGAVIAPRYDVRSVGAPPTVAPAPPVTELQRRVCEVWRELFQLNRDVGINEDFHSLGGDSLMAARLFVALEEELGHELPSSAMGRLSTIQRLALILEHPHAEGERDERARRVGLSPAIVRGIAAHTASWGGLQASPCSVSFTLNSSGTQPPLFWCCQGFNELSALARELGSDQPVVGMRSGHRVMDKHRANTVALAALYADEILSLRPVGPYVLGGNCQAARIAFHMAKRLRRLGHEVRVLFMMEQFVPEPFDAPVAFLFGTPNEYIPHAYFRDPEQGFRKYYTGGYEVYNLPGHHGAYFADAHVSALAEHIRHTLEHPIPRRSRTIDDPWQRLPPEAYRAYLHARLPQRATCGKAVRLRVRASNPTRHVWLPTAHSAIRLSNRWLDAKGQLAKWYDGEALLERAVYPGQSVRLRSVVRAPQEPGTYRLQLDLVEEGVTWFADHGSVPLEQIVTVTERDAP